MSELILYSTEDGQSHIQLHSNGQTVWLKNPDGRPDYFDEMQARTDELYLQFDLDRKQAEALQADQQGVADLRTLDYRIKERRKP